MSLSCKPIVGSSKHKAFRKALSLFAKPALSSGLLLRTEFPLPCPLSDSPNRLPTKNKPVRNFFDHVYGDFLSLSRILSSYSTKIRKRLCNRHRRQFLDIFPLILTDKASGFNLFAVAIGDKSYPEINRFSKPVASRTGSIRTVEGK